MLDDIILYSELEYACLVLFDMGEEEGLGLLKVSYLGFEFENMWLVFDHMILVMNKVLIEVNLFIEE